MSARVQIHDAQGMLLQARVADGFWSRGRGLMGRRALPQGEGMWLTPCRSIHTCFMRFRIDAVFFDRDGRVTRVHPNLGPWRFASGGPGACAVLEVSAGWLDLSRLAPGAKTALRAPGGH